jgi:hypothetical protein
MALSANRCAYSLKPIDASHSAMPVMALPVDGVLDHTRSADSLHYS